jgi:threonine/homoserine/homoserine lactone efflux protein
MTGDLRQAFAFVLGVLVAQSLLLALAMVGALAWLALYPDAVRALRWLGATFIVVVAVRLWRGSRTGVGAQPVATDLVSGAALTLASPYNPALYLAVVPSLGWRIEALPLHVAAATLGPTLVVCAVAILIGRLCRSWLSARPRPLARRALAASLGAVAAWIAVG